MKTYFEEKMENVYLKIKDEACCDECYYHIYMRLVLNTFDVVCDAVYDESRLIMDLDYPLIDLDKLAMLNRHYILQAAADRLDGELTDNDYWSFKTLYVIINRTLEAYKKGQVL